LSAEDPAGAAYRRAREAERAPAEREPFDCARIEPPPCERWRRRLRGARRRRKQSARRTGAERAYDLLEHEDLGDRICEREGLVLRDR
jgi:hypothetical protein